LSAGINSWTTQGPAAGRIDQVYVDPVTPSNIYAVLPYGGIFKTSNRGLSWRAVNRGIRLPASDLAIDPRMPSVLYAGTYFGQGIFKSTDGAESWCETGLTGFSVVSIAVDPLNSAILYAGTAEGGVFKTIDGGASWSSANVGLSGTGVEAIAIDGQNPDVLYAASAAGVFRSADAGSSWMSANEGITSTVNVIRIDPTDSSIVYAGTFGGGIFKTTDQGQTWAAMNAGLTDLYIDGLAIDRQEPSRLLAAAGFGLQSGLFATTDGAQQWIRIETGFVAAGEAVAIDPTDSTIIYAGMTLSAFRGAFIQSRDGGKTWSESSAGLSGSLIPAVAAHPSLPQTSYAAAFPRAYRTADGGRTWSAQGNLPSVHVLLPDPSNGETLYLGTSGSGVWKSVDAAATWNPVNTGLTDLQVWALATDQKAKAIYAATNAGLFKTSNGGESWSQTAAVGEFGVRTVAVDPKNARIVYAAPFNAGLYRSANGGASWTPLANLGVVGALAVDPSDSARIYAVSNGSGVFRSEDAGLTWKSVSDGLPFLEFLFRLAIDPIHPSTLYVSLYGSVFRTTDRGDHWMDFTNGMGFGGGLQLFSLAVNANGTTVYAGNFGGVFDYEIQPYSFHTVTPCRVVDTRTSGVALDAGSKRTFEVTGRCGVPPTARAVALNTTATEATSQGHLTLHETGTSPPDTISIAYRAGQTRANNAIVALDPLGRLTVKCNQPSGSVHVILDVSGYFE
jgi:photosystem II stability/assembly factor-like uncharacterized protein